MEESTKKNFKAGLIVTIIELVIIAIYFLIIISGFSHASDIFSVFNRLKGAFVFITLATLLLAILILTIKPLRTKTTIRWAVLDIVWAIGNIYLLMQ